MPNIPSLTRLLHFATHPGYLARRIAYKFYERLHPDEPWISQGAVSFCEKTLAPPMKGLEWGSGRSTSWFAARLGSLISIEHHAGWHATVSGKLRKLGVKNVDYRLIALSHDEKEPTRPIYDPVPEYVSVVEKLGELDFVVVDGHYRQACIRAALPRIRPGGFLLLDNSNWLPLEQWGVPRDWAVVHQSSNVMTQTTIWQKPK